MTVPVWTVILDSEVDAESPITESLMTRLRDNPLALLGVDPLDPAPVLQPVNSIEAANTTILTDSVETRLTLLTGRGESFQVIDGLNYGNGQTFFWFDENLLGIQTFILAVWGIKVVVAYTAGNPTGVTVLAGYDNTGNAGGIVGASIPITNTWTTVISSALGSGGNFQAKVRADSSGLLIAFREDSFGIPWNPLRMLGLGYLANQVSKA